MPDIEMVGMTQPEGRQQTKKLGDEQATKTNVSTKG